MVQVQSTWFPLVDRNPQTFVANIFEAEADDFVVAEQGVDMTAGSGGVALEPAQQIDDLPRIRSPIEDIARLHENRPAAAPPGAAVYDSGGAEDADETVVRAVHVADRHDALGRSKLAGRPCARLSCGSGGSAGQEKGQQNGPQRPAKATRKSGSEHGEQAHCVTLFGKAPHMETPLYQYAYGKPKEAPPAPQLTWTLRPSPR